jgi:uncharacterized protein YigE (DUF2233 family)
MKKLLLALAICLQFVDVWAGAQMWTPLKKGIELQQDTFPDDGHKVRYTLVRIDPKESNVSIVETFHYLGSKNYFSAYSLRAIDSKAGATVVVNAGAQKTYNAPHPSGLLQIAGQIVSEAKDPHATSEVQDGILCLSRASADILPLPSAKPPCVDAVQEGPFLKDKGAVQKLVGRGKRYNRTIAGITYDGKLVILVTKDGATNYGSAVYLFDRKDLNIRSLLFLEDGDDTGLIYHSPEGTAKPVTFGEVDSLIGSAITIH